MLVTVVEEVPCISDRERAELLASLEASRADYAAGNFHEYNEEMLHRECEAILQHNATDAELDRMLGLDPVTGRPLP